MNKVLAAIMAVLLVILPSCKDKSKVDELAPDENTLLVSGFLAEVFSDVLLPQFDGYQDMSDELNEAVLFTAVYYGRISKYPDISADSLTKAQIDENIIDIYGEEAAKNVDYAALSAEYDEMSGFYKPAVYGAPSWGFVHVIHSTAVEGDTVTAEVSYIDTNAIIRAIGADGEFVTLFSLIAAGEALDDRTRLTDELKADILASPEKYRVDRFTFKKDGDHLSLVSMKTK